jgi:hypothetical protein
MQQNQSVDIIPVNLMTPSGFNFRSAARAPALARASHVETTSPLVRFAHKGGEQGSQALRTVSGIRSAFPGTVAALI